MASQRYLSCIARCRLKQEQHPQLYSLLKNWDSIRLFLKVTQKCLCTPWLIIHPSYPRLVHWLMMLDSMQSFLQNYITLIFIYLFFWEEHYSHVKREGNMVAHSLACCALTISDFVMWMKDVPSPFLSIVLSNIAGLP